MATLDHISGAEPSTVTFKLATVKQTINSSAMHKEIQIVGDPDSSVALAAVLNAVPASTAWGLVTREAGGTLSSLGGIVVIQGNSTVAPLAGSTWNVRPVQSSAADLQMTATQGTNPWVIAGNSTVAPLAGSTWATRPIQSSQGDLRMTAYQSTIADLNATVTPLAGSTWRTQPGSTLWASSAGFHFDSSGAMLIAGSFSAAFSSTKADNLVTVYQSSAADLNVTVGNSVLSVRGQQANDVAIGGSNNPILIGGYVSDVAPTAASSNGNLQRIWVTPTGALHAITLDSSNAPVKPGDSANNALRANIVAGTVGLNLGTLQSTSAPAGGSSGLIVRIAGGPSSAVDCAIRSVLSSTSADNPVLATIGTNLQSTAAPSSNSSGLTVRQVIDNILTTASTNAFSASTSFSIQSSGAGLRSYVVAYSILSTNAGPHRIKFYSSGTMMWPVIFAAVSSAVSGANLAVSAPAYLFRTANQEALTLQLGSGASTIAGYQVAVSYFRAP